MVEPSPIGRIPFRSNRGRVAKNGNAIRAAKMSLEAAWMPLDQAARRIGAMGAGVVDYFWEGEPLEIGLSDRLGAVYGPLFSVPCPFFGRLPRELFK